MNYPGGTPEQRSIPNATLTKTELTSFIVESPQNAVSFAVLRNPTTVYEYIQQNYPGQSPNLKRGAEATLPNIESMHKFLMRQYRNLPATARPHMLYTLLHSLPTNSQLPNWTTPIN